MLASLPYHTALIPYCSFQSHTYPYSNTIQSYSFLYYPLFFSIFPVSVPITHSYLILGQQLNGQEKEEVRITLTAVEESNMIHLLLEIYLPKNKILKFRDH